MGWRISDAHQDYISRAQECKQRNYDTMKNKKERSRQAGDEEILPFLQETHHAQGNDKMSLLLFLTLYKNGYGYPKCLGCEGYGKNKIAR